MAPTNESYVIYINRKSATERYTREGQLREGLDAWGGLSPPAGHACGAAVLRSS